MVACCMKVGDLVLWKPSLPILYHSDCNYGIVLEIIDEFLVGVAWGSSSYIYMEAIDNLEVINESRRFG